MSSDLRKFLRKLALFSLPAVVLVVIPFVVYDPFQILRTRRDPNPDVIDNHAVYTNLEYIAIETYLARRQEHKIGSLIFGGSRSSVYKCEAWSKYLGDSRCFFFGANSETLFGIAGKVRLLDRLGDPIDNALLVLDDEGLAKITNSTGHIFMKHPLVADEPAAYLYAAILKAYVSDLFFLKFLDLELFKTYRPYMANAFKAAPAHFDPETMTWYFAEDDELAADEAGYYARRQRVFYQRSPVPQVSPPVLGPPQVALLEQIHATFLRRHTNYHLVISPLYNQQQFNPVDLAKLQSIFGADQVQDFSGVNELTAAVTNYYETSHYRPKVANQILSMLYAH